MSALLRVVPRFRRWALNPTSFADDRKLLHNRYASVAQLDRASGFEPEGRRFESFRAHQISLRIRGSKQTGESAEGRLPFVMCCGCAAGVVEEVDRLPSSRRRKVGVAHRGLQVDVAEQLLHGHDGSSAHHEVRREGVAIMPGPA